MLALALGAGCSAPSTIPGYVGEDSWETIDPIGVQLRLGKLDRQGEQGGTVAIAVRDQVVASGAAQAGTALPVTIEGEACAVHVVGTYSFDDTSERRVHPRAKRPGGPPVVGRTYRGLDVEVRCASGPVPGSPASRRGANPRRSMAAMLPIGALGALAGSFARGDRKRGERIGTAFLIFLAAIGAAIAIAFTLFDGGFRLPLGLVGAGAAIAGLIGGRLWQRKRPHVSYAWGAGAIAGALPIVVLSPAWSYGGPLAALACAAGGAIVASVIAVLIKPLV